MKAQSTTKKKIYRALFLISLAMNAVVVVIISTPLVNRLYEHLEVAPEVKKADSIILLPSGYYTEDIPEQNSFQRMLHALSLYKGG